MADNQNIPEFEDDGVSSDADRETEREQIRSSNDRDQQLEREGEISRHNEGYDEAVKGRENSEPTDPDSAESENDRDDMIDE